MSKNELYERGVLYDDDDDGDRIAYQPADDRDDARHDFEDEPPAQPQRRCEATAGTRSTYFDTLEACLRFRRR